MASEGDGAELHLQFHQVTKCRTVRASPAAAAPSSPWWCSSWSAVATSHEPLERNARSQKVGLLFVPFCCVVTLFTACDWSKKRNRVCTARIAGAWAKTRLGKQSLFVAVHSITFGLYRRWRMRISLF